MLTKLSANQTKIVKSRLKRVKLAFRSVLKISELPNSTIERDRKSSHVIRMEGFA